MPHTALKNRAPPPLLRNHKERGPMQLIPTDIPDLFAVELKAHRDNRGFFVETWREEWAKKLKLRHPFVQDNHARSEEKGVLRGLHFQVPPHEQSKLVWVTRGAAFDVAVDLRKGSPTYGKWHSILLSEDNMLRFFIPPGFAHGYMTLEPETEFHYKVDAYYAPGHEGGIRFDDPALAIPWPGIAPLLSEKDRLLPLMNALDSPFEYRKKR